MNGTERGQAAFGRVLREAREAEGLEPSRLARELHLPLHLLEALEAEDWERVPPGRERPLARLVAQRLGVDPEAHPEVWALLPGSSEQEGADPGQERLERALMYGVAAGTLALLAWLVVPGRDLKRSIVSPEAASAQPGARPWNAPPPSGPYPVLGEVLPERPVTEEGVLVSLRSLDATEARIVTEDGQERRQALHVSEPWRLRVKGPFTVLLDNAGVVSLEVANRPIPHGRTVGEAWSGRFGADGTWILPAEPKPEEASPPETEGSEGSEE